MLQPHEGNRGDSPHLCEQIPDDLTPEELRLYEGMKHSPAVLQHILSIRAARAAAPVKAPPQEPPPKPAIVLHPSIVAAAELVPGVEPSRQLPTVVDVVPVKVSTTSKAQPPIVAVQVVEPEKPKSQFPRLVEPPQEAPVDAPREAEEPQEPNAPVLANGSRYHPKLGPMPGDLEGLWQLVRREMAQAEATLSDSDFESVAQWVVTYPCRCWFDGMEDAWAHLEGQEDLCGWFGCYEEFEQVWLSVQRPVWRLQKAVAATTNDFQCPELKLESKGPSLVRRVAGIIHHLQATNGGKPVFVHQVSFAQAIGVTRQSVSRAVGVLIRKGFLEEKKMFVTIRRKPKVAPFLWRYMIERRPKGCTAGEAYKFLRHKYAKTQELRTDLDALVDCDPPWLEREESFAIGRLPKVVYRAIKDADKYQRND